MALIGWLTARLLKRMQFGVNGGMARPRARGGPGGGSGRLGLCGRAAGRERAVSRGQNGHTSGAWSLHSGLVRSWREGRQTWPETGTLWRFVVAHGLGVAAASGGAGRRGGSHRGGWLHARSGGLIRGLFLFSTRHLSRKHLAVRMVGAIERIASIKWARGVAFRALGAGERVNGDFRIDGIWGWMGGRGKGGALGVAEGVGLMGGVVVRGRLLRRGLLAMTEVVGGGGCFVGD